MKKTTLIMLLGIILCLGAVSCKKDDPEPTPEPLKTATVTLGFNQKCSNTLKPCENYAVKIKDANGNDIINPTVTDKNGKVKGIVIPIQDVPYKAIITAKSDLCLNDGKLYTFTFELKKEGQVTDYTFTLEQ